MRHRDPAERDRPPQAAPTRGGPGTAELPRDRFGEREPRTEPLPRFHRPSPRRPGAPEVVRRRSRPHHHVPGPDEAERTRQLVRDLLGRGCEVGGPPPPVRVRLLLGALCSVLLLGAAVAITALSTAPAPAAPPRHPAELALRPDLLPGHPDAHPVNAAPPPAPPVIAPPATAPDGANPAAGSALGALEAARAFYAQLDADPRRAVAVLGPRLRGQAAEIAQAWAGAEVRRLELHPIGPRQVLAEVEAAYPGGPRFVLRHRLTVSADGRWLLGAELRWAQRFPR